METNSDIQPSVRTLRRKQNETMNEFVIKVGLYDALRVDKVQKNLLLYEISRRVEAVSKGVHRLSLAINLLIKESLSSHVDKRKCTAFDFKDTTFSMQVMLASGRKDFDETKIFLDKYNCILPPPPSRRVGDTNSFISAVDGYLTNYKTFLTTEFEKRQSMFCRRWCEKHGFPTSESYMLAKKVNGYQILGQEPNWLKSERAKKHIAYIRSLLDLKGLESQVSDFWMKKHYWNILCYFAIINDWTVKNGGKKMSIGPIASIKAHFIYIDSRVLLGILKSIDYTVVKTSLNKAVTEASIETWEEIVNVYKYISKTQKEQKNFKFTRTIQTDGVSICIHYRRPNLGPIVSSTVDVIEEGKPKEDLPFDGDYRVIGIDPGRSSLITAAELLPDGSYVSYKLSRAMYYHESGINSFNKKKDRWNLKVKEALVDLSTTTTKGTSVEELKKYIEVVLKHYDSLWSENLKRKWGRWRFKTYMGKEKTIQKFLKSLQTKGEKRNDHREIVLAYGDAGFASNGKGERSVPTTTLARRCLKKYKVKMIDEFRTTQLSYDTGSRMSKVVEKESGFSIRGLYWCSSTKDGKFVDRDVNAALNILKCYKMLPTRPMGLSRNDGVQQEPPVKIIKSLSKKLRNGLPRKRFSLGFRKNTASFQSSRNYFGFLYSSLLAS